MFGLNKKNKSLRENMLMEQLIVILRISKIEPEDFAKELMNKKENSEYIKKIADSVIHLIDRSIALKEAELKSEL